MSSAGPRDRLVMLENDADVAAAASIGAPTPPPANTDDAPAGVILSTRDSVGEGPHTMVA